MHSVNLLASLQILNTNNLFSNTINMFNDWPKLKKTGISIASISEYRSVQRLALLILRIQKRGEKTTATITTAGTIYISIYIYIYILYMICTWWTAKFLWCICCIIPTFFLTCLQKFMAHGKKIDKIHELESSNSSTSIAISVSIYCVLVNTKQFYTW